MDRNNRNILGISSVLGRSPFPGLLLRDSSSASIVSKSLIGGTYLSEGIFDFLLVKLRPRAHSV
jgi:hypothetical protein